MASLPAICYRYVPPRTKEKATPHKLEQMLFTIHLVIR